MARGGIKLKQAYTARLKHTNWLEQGCIFPGIPTHNSKHAQFQQKTQKETKKHTKKTSKPT